MNSEPNLVGSAFRKASLVERRAMLSDQLASPVSLENAWGGNAEQEACAERFVEQAAGIAAIPLGIVPSLMVNGVPSAIPLATEEPSVVAAASFACKMIGETGGFAAVSGAPLGIATIYLEGLSTAAANDLESKVTDLVREHSRSLLEGMTARGGGLQDVSLHQLGADLVRVDITIDTRDAMGANLLNSVAEECAAPLADASGSNVLMAILTNAAPFRLTTARCTIPCSRRTLDEQLARRIAKASAVAELDPFRAVTHNKGIMNGISALLLACGNDTRAAEAAIHNHAHRSAENPGLPCPARPLATWTFINNELHGTIELPMVCATVGGALSAPYARASLAVMGNPDAQRLACIAASLGLAQNFAALRALVSEGIQAGHMRLHKRRSTS